MSARTYATGAVGWARETLARYDNYDIGAGDASNNAQDVD